MDDVKNKQLQIEKRISDLFNLYVAEYKNSEVILQESMSLIFATYKADLLKLSTGSGFGFKGTKSKEVEQLYDEMKLKIIDAYQKPRNINHSNLEVLLAELLNICGLEDLAQSRQNKERCNDLEKEVDILRDEMHKKLTRLEQDSACALRKERKKTAESHERFNQLKEVNKLLIKIKKEKAKERRQREEERKAYEEANPPTDLHEKLMNDADLLTPYLREIEERKMQWKQMKKESKVLETLETELLGSDD